MSLYNILFGVNPDADTILAIIGIKKEDIPRFRDVYTLKINRSAAVDIYTRTGGGNREEYEEENKQLCAHENFLYDEDDEGDSTYAHFYFSVLSKGTNSFHKISKENQVE